MRKYYCDRCKEEIGKAELTYDSEFISEIIAEFLFYNFDLCDDCRLLTGGKITDILNFDSKEKTIFSQSIDDLELTIRGVNCLLGEGINTIGELLTKRKKDLRYVPNLGRVTLNEIEERLSERGLKLKS